MKTEVTNQKLLQMDNELQQILPTAIGMLLHSRIVEFYKKNGIRIQVAQEKVKKIQKKHLMYNEDGTIKFPKDPIPGKPAVPMFLLGHTEEDLQKEYGVLMQETVSIEI